MQAAEKKRHTRFCYVAAVGQPAFHALVCMSQRIRKSFSELVFWRRCIYRGKKCEWKNTRHAMYLGMPCSMWTRWVGLITNFGRFSAMKYGRFWVSSALRWRTNKSVNGHKSHKSLAYQHFPHFCHPCHRPFGHKAISAINFSPHHTQRVRLQRVHGVCVTKLKYAKRNSCNFPIEFVNSVAYSALIRRLSSQFLQ